MAKFFNKKNSKKAAESKDEENKSVKEAGKQKQPDNNGLEAELKKTKQKINNLESEKVKLNSEKMKLESEKVKLESANGQLKTQNKKLDEDLKKEKENRKNLEKEINDLKKQVEAEKKQIKKEKENIEKEINDLKKQVEAEKKQIKKEKENIEKGKKSLEEEEKKLDAVRKEVKGKKAEQERERVELNEYKNELDGINERLDRQENNLLEREKRLQFEKKNAVAGFLAENEKIWATYKSAMAEIYADVQEKVSEALNLQNEIFKNQSQTPQEMIDEIEDFKKQILEMNERKMNQHLRLLENIQEEYQEQIKSYMTTKLRYDRQESDLHMRAVTLNAKSVELENRKREFENEIREIKENDKNFYVQRYSTVIDTLKNQNIKLQEELSEYQQAENRAGQMYNLKNYENVKKMADDNNTLRDENLNLRMKLANMPSDFDIEELKRARKIIENYEEKIEEQNEELARTRTIAMREQIAIAENTELKIYKELYNVNIKDITRQLEELKKINGDETIEEVRLAAVNEPYFPVVAANHESRIDEIEWLDGILEKCRNSEYIFSKRLLYAFHTALKISDWSPITVLAGISGIGKSSLPRLYSRFGGFYFLMVSVQPDWDSPQSIFGYFNSIDNKFNAAPVLRAMVQGSENNEYNLKDRMIMILLDEMNLAHVELYFSEMLSKLEERRDKNEDEITAIEIDVGAGMDRHKVNLTKNIFWVGTMNEDETTKSLSDKVIDRGNVITLPSPESFSSRTDTTIEDEEDKISTTVWKNWLNSKVSFDTGKNSVISKYKESVENINKWLKMIGRSLGNRIWQSIENYMANYPLVIKYNRENNKEKFDIAMKLAFEDALVQKVMPKLRGIELEGESKEYLDKIGEEITKSARGIKGDYMKACEHPYGIFIWSSSEYLNKWVDSEDEEIVEGEKTEEVPVDSKENCEVEKAVVVENGENA